MLITPATYVSFCFSSIIVLFLSATTTSGLPVQLQKRIVYRCPITSPSTGDIFAAGDTTTITWDTSAIPTLPLNNGTIVLGFMQDDDPNEHLDMEHPLASGFALQTGKQTVTLPTYLPSRNDYIITLFGDSGNISPRFTIQAQSGLQLTIVEK